MQVRVHLHGIDAPEQGQPFNRRAKEELSALVFGKVVGIEDHGKDRYGRTIGRAFIDGLDVCEHYVEQGMAWHYTQHDDSAALRDAEERARRAKRGLGQGRESVPPWGGGNSTSTSGSGGGSLRRWGRSEVFDARLRFGTSGRRLRLAPSGPALLSFVRLR